MAGITLEKGQTIYKYGQPMTALHLITSGKIKVSYPGGSFHLSKGGVIGICEICSEVHFLEYSVEEDATIVTYSLATLAVLDDILKKHPEVARLFLLSAFYQINILLDQCSVAALNCSSLHQSLMEDYSKYCTICNRYRTQPRILPVMDELTAYLGEEAPDFWLTGYYLGLTKVYSGDTYKIMVSDSALSSGFLRKCSLDVRRTYAGLDEQYRYQKQIADLYFHESGNDLFDFYTALYCKLGTGIEEAGELYSDINRMISLFQSGSYVDADYLADRVRSFQSSIAMLKAPAASASVSTQEDDNSAVLNELTGSLNTILEYAGHDLDIAASFRQDVLAYKRLPDKASTDNEVCQLRAKLTESFYQLYSTVFERTLESTPVPAPVSMFLYFGYVDEELAGIKNAIRLYQLAQEMHDHSGSGYYTFYDWLLAIYQGKKEPSRNEFDEDYSDYVHKQKAAGNISELEAKELEQNTMAKVRFELQNMFPSVNKMTYGRIATFCPLFTEDNVLKDLSDSYVTASAVGQALEQIRKIDYTAFYREVLSTEHFEAMGKEPIHVEYLPDVILMPNVGIRGVMWQEIEGKRRSTPGRMLVSIFHMEDLGTTLIRLTGEFRWEMCKRIQGSRWNDVSESSLTSEYFDYIQFFRKNHDLTTEAKDRLMTALQRAKNSFKEMFVRDYVVWIMFEGNGSPRLNKVARRILFTYCPFPAALQETIQLNPLYTEIINRHKILAAQRIHRLDKLEKKLLNSRIPVPDVLEQERNYTAGNLPN